MSLLWTGPPTNQIELAVAFSRGIQGRMNPDPDAADSDSAIVLLQFASKIQAAEEPACPRRAPIMKSIKPVYIYLAILVGAAVACLSAWLASLAPAIEFGMDVGRLI